MPVLALGSQPLALSTSWNGVRASMPSALLEEVTSLGFRRIEVYVRESGLTSTVAAPIFVEGELWGAVAASSVNADPLPDGHGLSLLRDRLAMLFEGRASLRVDSQPGATTVTMDIPNHKGHEGHEGHEGPREQDGFGGDQH